jgi:hypothetical protein
MKILRAKKLYRPWAEAMESRIVLDAAFPFAVAIGDTLPSAGAGASISPMSQIGTDSAGDVYVAGNFANLAHFGTGPGEPTNQCSGDPTLPDAFIAKYSSTGTLVWHEALQPSIGTFSSASVSLGGIAVDGAGDVFLTGMPSSRWLIRSCCRKVPQSFSSMMASSSCVSIAWASSRG